MDLCEEDEVEVYTGHQKQRLESSTCLSAEDERRELKDQRPNSPTASCVSVKTDRSRDEPPYLSNKPLPVDSADSKPKSQKQRPLSPTPSCLSMRSDESKGLPLVFKKEQSGSDSKRELKDQRPNSPTASCVSVKTDRSRDEPPYLSNKPLPVDSADSKPKSQKQRPLSPTPSCLSMRSDESKGLPLVFKKEQSGSDSKDQLYQSQRPDSPTLSHLSISDQSMGIPLAFNSETIPAVHVQQPPSQAFRKDSEIVTDDVQEALNKHRINLKKKFEYVMEGSAEEKSGIHLSTIYTELYITEGECEWINTQHEVWQLETVFTLKTFCGTAINCNDIFKPLTGQNECLKVLTKGIAGSGKTVCAQKVILDWVEGKANHTVKILFALPFRELNLIKGAKYSLLGLLSLFHPSLEKLTVEMLTMWKVAFILDGLDESRLTLNFKCNEHVSNVTQISTVDKLLTSLIKGKLLPSALLWITCRPAAANLIPPQYIHRVTEVRGFTDPQKEDYFKKRFCDDEQAGKIISHIRALKSLQIMCHIPVFCWMIATVFEYMQSTNTGELPKTLTEMYAHFLMVQTQRKNNKYGKAEMNQQELIKTDKEVLLKLGRLAFEHLEKGNLMFYKEDLEECGLYVNDAALYSGVCTAIFKEECVLFKKMVYCFVHLSIQEFLAAVYAYHCYATQNINAMKSSLSLHELLEGALEKALESRNGHLDLFVRFLHGLTIESNQRALGGLIVQKSRPESIKKHIRTLKMVQRKAASTERCINLSHCLTEMNDHSVDQEIQELLESENRSKQKLSAVQCSTLAYKLLMSEKVLDKFDLRTFNTLDEGRRRLVPVVRNCTNAQLSGCGLKTEDVCDVVASALSSNPSHLRELDLSNNELQDSGVKLLSAGLQSVNCKLSNLRLSGCLITEDGCVSLASALNSNPSHLRELDLSYNHPGDSGVTLLSAGLKDPHWTLDTLRVDHGGEHRLISGPRKYLFRPTLDPNTAHKRLSLCEQSGQVSHTEEWHPYPDHPERFYLQDQVLCRECLTGCSYLEVDMAGGAFIGVAYKGINRTGSYESWLGYNDKSWCVSCFGPNYKVLHDWRETNIPIAITSPRVGVYLDWPRGTLSFYKVTSESLVHLHTFHHRFTEALYPGFYVPYNTSLSLC
ncbi:NLR family CARD domain-containing protein 3-like [Epinephelus moara]|uniref:NLR family CARD domain-containing protein 3-like n=1 Tax=Epinephelus moara TaxID=300413 RepID=UPI00214F5435|nr:NLR family CARD domain-containing protein 3-like [Epinephelus moara]